MSNSLKVMAVDDDVINLEILNKNLKDAGFECISFEDGDVAWGYMNSNPEEIDIVLLDKMMPRMNGMEVLKRMKSHKVLRNVPVIIQTGDIGVQETKQGLAAGAYYYLEKPFDPSVMVSLVHAAARDHVHHDDVRTSMKQEKAVAHLLLEGQFKYKTIEDAKRLAGVLSYYSSNPDETSVALSEILINAVEHGNLGINYEEKNTLLSKNKLEEEVQLRYDLPAYKDRRVTVNYHRTPERITITIDDEGEGFEWDQFMDFDPLRLTDLNGRGIATAKLMGLNISYENNGTRAICSYAAKAEESDDMPAN
tara:strand:- start:263 stop:1186 length:924 start_codon:yes stop_codon:yes gene_type:complete